MRLEDCPADQRPNLHHTHDALAEGVHTHDIVDHYGRTIDAVEHSHDPDGNVTVAGARHKPAKRPGVLPAA